MVYNNLTEDSALKILQKKSSSTLIDFYNMPYHLSEDKILHYQENGFVKLENVVDDKVLNEISDFIASVVYLRKGKDALNLSSRSQYHQSFLQCGFLCWDYEPLKDFVFSKRFAGIAANLMKTEHVRLWHDQALFKEPGGRITDIHQDCSYWPIAQPEFTITMWLALTDVPAEKGCLYFYPKTNKTSLKEYVDIFKNPHEPQILKKSEKQFIPLKAGDATFHSGLTFHGAGNNITNEMRAAMTIIYIKDGVTFDASDERNKTHTSCSGLNDGEVINTKFTPILI